MKGLCALVAVTLAGLGQLTSAAAGDALERLKGCAQFEGMERLKCVDDLLGEVAEPAASALPQEPTWIVSETTSPVDYKPQLVARITLRAAANDAPSSLAIYCRANRTELMISTAGVWKQSADGDVRVLYQVDKQPPVEHRWKAAEGGRSLVFPGDVVRFLRAMPEGSRFLVKVYAGKAPPSDNTFQLRGLESVRRRLAEACSWPQ